MKNKRIKIAGSLLVLAGLSLQLIYSPILAENNAGDSQPASVSAANGTTEFKQGKSYALINDVNNDGETQVLFGDTEKEAKENKDKGSVDIHRHISSDGKSVKWKVYFNKAGETWRYGSLLSLVLPLGLKEPVRITRYTETPDNKIGLQDRINVKKHFGNNITGRWRHDENTASLVGEFDKILYPSEGYNAHMLKTLSEKKKFKTILVDKESGWSFSKRYIWEFETELEDGYKAEDLFLGAGIRQGDHAFPRASFVGPFDTDGDGTPDYIEKKNGTNPTVDEREFPNIDIDDIYKGMSSFTFSMTNKPHVQNALPDSFEVKFYKNNKDADTQPARNDMDHHVYFDLQNDGTYQVRKDTHTDGYELKSLGNNKWQVIVPKKGNFANGFDAKDNVEKDKVSLVPYFNKLKDVAGDGYEREPRVVQVFFENTIFPTVAVPSAIVKDIYEGQDSITIIPVDFPPIISIDILLDGSTRDVSKVILGRDDDGEHYVIQENPSTYQTEPYLPSKLTQNKDGSLTIKFNDNKMFKSGGLIGVKQYKENKLKPAPDNFDPSDYVKKAALPNDAPVITAEPDGTNAPITLIKGETNKLAKITVNDKEDGEIKLKTQNFKHIDGLEYEVKKDGTVFVKLSDSANTGQQEIVVGSASNGSQEIKDKIGKAASEQKIKVNIVDKPKPVTTLSAELGNTITKSNSELENLIENISALKTQDPRLSVRLSEKQIDSSIQKDRSGGFSVLVNENPQSVSLELSFTDGKKHILDVPVNITPPSKLPEPRPASPRPLNEGEKLTLTNLDSKNWLENIGEIIRYGGTVEVDENQEDSEQVKKENGEWTIIPKEGSTEIPLKLKVKYPNGTEYQFKVTQKINKKPIINFAPTKETETGEDDKPILIVANNNEIEIGTLTVTDPDGSKEIALSEKNVDGSALSFITANNEKLKVVYDDKTKKIKVTAANDLVAGDYTITIGDKEKSPITDENGGVAEPKTLKIKVIDQQTAELNKKKDEAKKEVDKVIDDKKAELDKITDPAEKKKRQDEINNLADQAKKEIEAATSEEEINNAVNKFKKKVEAVDKINKARKDKLDEIKRKFDQNILTEAEKNKYNEEVNKLADDAIAEISKPETTGEKAETTADTAVGEIKKVNPLGKEKAKTEIDTIINKKQDEINKITDEKQKEREKAVLEKIKEVGNKAKEEIKNANTQDGVNNALDKFKKKVDLIDKINKARKDKLDEIKKKHEDGIITDEEKEAFDKEVNKLADEAIAEIAKPDTTAETAGKTAETSIKNIKEINPIGKAKKLKEIDEIVKNKQEEFDKITDPAEKQKRKDELTKLVDQAKKEIDEAKTQEDVTNALNKFKKKVDFIEKINKARQEKLDEIKQKFDDGILTEKEKEAYDKEVNKLADEAIATIIEPNTTVEKAEITADTAIENIKKINPLGKEKAINEIEELAKKYIEKINYGPNKLTLKEQDEYTKRFEQIRDIYIDLINKATSNEKIKELLEKARKAFSLAIIDANWLDIVRNDQKQEAQKTVMLKHNDKKQKQKDKVPSTSASEGKIITLTLLTMLLAAGILKTRKNY